MLSVTDIAQETPVPPENEPDGPIDAPPPDPEPDFDELTAPGGGTGGATGEPGEPGQSNI